MEMWLEEEKGKNRGDMEVRREEEEKKIKEGMFKFDVNVKKDRVETTSLTTAHAVSSLITSVGKLLEVIPTSAVQYAKSTVASSFLNNIWLQSSCLDVMKFISDTCKNKWRLGQDTQPKCSHSLCPHFYQLTPIVKTPEATHCPAGRSAATNVTAPPVAGRGGMQRADGLRHQQHTLEEENDASSSLPNTVVTTTPACDRVHPRNKKKPTRSSMTTYVHRLTLLCRLYRYFWVKFPHQRWVQAAGASQTCSLLLYFGHLAVLVSHGMQSRCLNVNVSVFFFFLHSFWMQSCASNEVLNG